jgi:Rha family phage regulatory protein
MNDIVLKTAEGEIFTTSLLIADKFGKQHKDVLRKIDGMPKDEFNRRNFAPVDYVDEKGESRRSYRITRDGFAYIAMGFTGKKAHEWKVKFIDAFNKMEAHLKRIMEKGWLEHRAEAALEYRLMSSTLKEVRELNGKATQFHHYVNEAKLVNWALTGEFKKLDRAALGAEDLRVLTALETYNAVLIGAGIDRDGRKEKLRRRYCETRRVLEQAA